MRSSAKGYAPDNGRCSAEKSPCTDSVPHNDLPVGSNRFANRNPSAFELHRKSSVSLLVSVGVVLMPLPRTGNDFLQTIVHRIPAQHALCLFTGRHQSGRVAGTAWGFYCRNVMSSHLACGFNYLTDRIPDSVSQIEDISSTAWM